MPFTDSEIAEHTALIEREFWAKRRPPLRIRDKMREGQRFDGLAIELFFVRPVFLRPGEFVEEPIAKVRFVRRRGVWRIYWERADLRWHSYEPCAEVPSLAVALRVIDEDRYCCFFG